MGYNVVLKYKNMKAIHIGKVSLGWKFMFNFQQLLKFALECGEFIWYEKYIKNTLDNLKQLQKVESYYYENYCNPNGLNWSTMFTIHTINSDIIEKILSLEGISLLTDHDYDEYNVKDFICRINNEIDKNNPKSKGVIDLGIYSGTSSDDFS